MAQEPPSNPIQQLIIDCQDDPTQIRERYENHRTTRNAQYKAKILDQDFKEWNVDEILYKLQAQTKLPDGQDFVDPRNNLAIWARPPQHIRELVDEIQKEIQSFAPSLWFTPSDCLHTTAFEITNSQTPLEIEKVASQLLETGIVPNVANHAYHHRARLIKPLISYDASAMALSFVPAAGEETDPPRSLEDDSYTYHHLRSDLFDQVVAAGIPINSRYTVPSAHITLARFITQEEFLLEKPGSNESQIDRESVSKLITNIEHLNQEIREKYWPKEDGRVPSKGEWIVGQEKGLEVAKGRSWYGKSDKIFAGQGF